MHLKEILDLRSTPAAGLFMQITMRCPLSCAHCCTDSRMNSEEHDGTVFERFADTFTPSDRPDVLMLTGGEPFLRPQLIESLAERAHAVGARVASISGMFFARKPTIPDSIQRALDSIDHLTASLDVFHEKEVSREAVFDILEERLKRGQRVSLQITGLGEDDPYLDDIATAIENRFGTEVPAIITGIGAEGRATDWVQLPKRLSAPIEDPSPCQMAAWPVISCTGNIVACCNQSVISGPTPIHLKLGNTENHNWETIRRGVEQSASLRALRTYGPKYIASRGSEPGHCSGYCDMCKTLPRDASVPGQLQAMVTTPGFDTLEWLTSQKASHQSYSLPKYAHLSGLGTGA